MAHLIAVTGATGKVGRALVERLVADGVEVRAVATRPERLVALTARGVEARVGRLEDTAFLTEAFRGAHAVFAMIPQHFDVPDYLADQRRLVESVTEALERAGVSHAVALSAAGAGLRGGPPALLDGFERRLRDIPGLSAVVLRPAFLMDNFLAALPLISTAGIHGSAVRGDVSLPMIAARDVAAAAAGYLLTPHFAGHAVQTLLGPREYTYREATSILGAAIGRPELPYVEFSFADARAGLLAAGLSESGADALLALSAAINDGTLQRLARQVGASTSSTTLEQFARDTFAPAYRASAPLTEPIVAR